MLLRIKSRKTMTGDKVLGKNLYALEKKNMIFNKEVQNVPVVHFGLPCSKLPTSIPILLLIWESPLGVITAPALNCEFLYCARYADPHQRYFSFL